MNLFQCCHQIQNNRKNILPKILSYIVPCSGWTEIICSPPVDLPPQLEMIQHWWRFTADYTHLEHNHRGSTCTAVLNNVGMWKHWEGSLNINMLSYQYIDSHTKFKQDQQHFLSSGSCIRKTYPSKLCEICYIWRGSAGNWNRQFYMRCVTYEPHDVRYAHNLWLGCFCEAEWARKGHSSELL